MTRSRAWWTLVLCVMGPVSAAHGASDHHLWDEAHLLSPRERSDVERRMEKARKRLGSPLFVMITDRLRHETAGQMADRVFADRRLGADPGSNPVLLLVVAHDHAAAIATGKGNAGIVPEMDAARITRELVRDGMIQDFKGRVVRALDAVVESAEATAARRRPLSAQDDDLPPPDRPDPPSPVRSPGAGDAASANPVPGAPPTAPHGPGQDKTTPSQGRSRVPLAVAAAALLLLALALRRRQQLAALRRGPKSGQGPEMKREGHSSDRARRRPRR